MDLEVESAIDQSSGQSFVLVTLHVEPELIALKLTYAAARRIADAILRIVESEDSRV